MLPCTPPAASRGEAWYLPTPAASRGEAWYLPFSWFEMGSVTPARVGSHEKIGHGWH